MFNRKTKRTMKKLFDKFSLYWIIKDIRNYVIYRRVIKEMKKDEEWNKFNLRSDIWGRVYTVLNMKEEYFGEPEDLLKFRVIERCAPIFNFFSINGLEDIVSPKTRYLGPDTVSYLLVIKPMFEELTLFNLLKQLFYFYILYRIGMYFFSSEIYTVIQKLLTILF